MTLVEQRELCDKRVLSGFVEDDCSVLVEIHGSGAVAIVPLTHELAVGIGGTGDCTGNEAAQAPRLNYPSDIHTTTISLPWRCVTSLFYRTGGAALRSCSARVISTWAKV